MKRVIATALISLLPLAPALAADADTQARTETSKAAIQDFFGTLKGELEKAMKEGGPINAIAVCNKTAPALTAVKSQEHGMDLSRVSTKARSPKNAPDAWEQGVLAKFEERKAAGEDVQLIAHAEVVESDGRKQFRFMKAIPTGEVCLKCHGEAIDEKVAAKLDEIYPEDQARGYKLGDIRGAFSVVQDM
jgi:hypothetical protein